MHSQAESAVAACFSTHLCAPGEIELDARSRYGPSYRIEHRTPNGGRAGLRRSRMSEGYEEKNKCYNF
jgi:hypothetical protein